MKMKRDLLRTQRLSPYSRHRAARRERPNSSPRTPSISVLESTEIIRQVSEAPGYKANGYWTDLMTSRVGEDLTVASPLATCHGECRHAMRKRLL